jgi:succinate dehydrogenase hydrophobic anchor subunit
MTGGGKTLRLALYRFRPTFPGRRGGYIALVVLLGLVGGLAMASLAGARRTQSSFPTFLASTNPSDLSLGTALANPALGYATGYDGSIIKRIAMLPGVTHAESYSEEYGVPLGADGKPIAATQNPNVNFTVDGSVNGLYFDMDRATVVAGRMADPRRPDEIVATADAAAELGLHLGQRAPWGFYTLAQAAASGNSEPSHPAIRTEFTLVGIVVLNNAVVQDDTDASHDQTVILTPTFTDRYLTCCADFTFTYLQLSHHAVSVTAAEREIERVIPSNLPYDFYDPSADVAKAEHVVKPEGIALGVFGAIAALATLLIAIQLMGRALRSSTGEAQVLRSIGATPAMTIADALMGIVAAVVLGTLAAGVVAVCLSPLFPLGPVRTVYPNHGISFDWTVLGFSALVLLALLVLTAFFLAWRAAPHRTHVNSAFATRSSSVADAAAGWGMSAPAVTGIRMALEPGSDGMPARSAILGAVLAMIVVIATIVFGSSLNALVAHPSLYGWNWAYELSGGGGVGDVPPTVDRLLAADHQVASWSSYYFGNLQVDGRTVPALGATPREAVGPPVLSGHTLDSNGEIVLGAATLAQLHKRVGGAVSVGYGAARPVPLRIVGTATMPAIGVSGVTGHLSIGTGAEVDYHFLPASERNAFGNTPAGPNAVFVRLKANVSMASARAALSAISDRLSLPTNYGVTLVSVQRPAEIVNDRSMGATPAILGLALATGAVAALGLTLIASVRRRRRDMAMLKAIGFTGRQLAHSVAWQASIAVGVGMVAGIPLGIVLGRGLWTLFADEIYVIPGPTIPALEIVAIAATALVLTNVVAAIPGRIAARTRTALLLRAE